MPLSPPFPSSSSPPLTFLLWAGRPAGEEEVTGTRRERRSDCRRCGDGARRYKSHLCGAMSSSRGPSSPLSHPNPIDPFAAVAAATAEAPPLRNPIIPHDPPSPEMEATAEALTWEGCCVGGGAAPSISLMCTGGSIGRSGGAAGVAWAKPARGRAAAAAALRVQGGQAGVRDGAEAEEMQLRRVQGADHGYGQVLPLPHPLR
ncbi:hypothetical protein [Oryza sativa Japonica Group]|uniref:Os01g0556001 protein n=3 Tax=Oryza sativa subsp. japonica TaxID=39947 RepID=Q5JM20_ORYSJ|nr:hypothetical protein [Oryza sativa Japonica Group]BAD87937.1 hypothetical protein [Oryza sativa Japonica Group]BAS72677.1 Os01g0556001 [Oryza sativa Japonica Group]